MRASHLLLPALAIGAAAYLAAPQPADAFVTLGFSLDLDQRDFRIFNNFLDAAANNNATAHSNWPGYTGAPLAIWKAGVEWQSELHGDGSGDPTQPNDVGSGGANFDPSWQGESTGIGALNGNVHSSLDANGGGVFAFTEAPDGAGWRIRYYENHTWSDGPGAIAFPFSQTDLQGIGAHEHGHALGLDHTFNGPTMQPGTTNAGSDDQRSIQADDIAGVQAIYGVKSPSKPSIDSISINGSTLTINGTNFSQSNNEVWFTRETISAAGFPVKVTGVLANPAGTQISISIPADAGPGDVLVRNDGTAHANLSNAFPIDPSGGGGNPAPSIASFNPSTVDAVTVDGPFVVTITGSGFANVDSLSVDGIALATFPAEFNVLNDNTITFDVPLVSKLGPVDVVIDGADGSDTGQITVVANDPPVIELVSSNPSFLTSAIGIQLVHGGEPGELYFSFLSTSLVPSSLPGLFDLGIGNGLLDLFLLVTPTIGAKGYQMTTFPFSGITPGTQLHFQSGVFELSLALPLTATNIQSGTVLF